MNKAVCVAIIRGGGFIAVSLKEDHSDFNLPGGMVEENETLEQAGIREVKEETGMDILNLKFLCTIIEDNIEVTIYYTYTYSGLINTTEDHIVKWLPLKVLNESKKWPVSNKEVYDKLIPEITIEAVCVVVLNDTKFLSVPLKYDANDHNLPGGTISVGKTIEEDAIDKVKDKTGIIVSNLNYLCNIKESRYNVHIYYTSEWSGDIGEFIDYCVSWKPLEVLLDTKRWKDANKIIFDKLKVIDNL